MGRPSGSAYFLVPIIGPSVDGAAGAFFYTRLIHPLLPTREVEPAPEGAPEPVPEPQVIA